MTSVNIGGNSSVAFPSVKEDIEEVKKKLELIGDSMTRIAAERDLIKENKKSLKDKFGMKPKLVTRLAKTLFNDDFEVGQMDNDEFVEAYNKVSGK